MEYTGDQSTILLFLVVLKSQVAPRNVMSKASKVKTAIK